MIHFFLYFLFFIRAEAQYCRPVLISKPIAPTWSIQGNQIIVSTSGIKLDTTFPLDEGAVAHVQLPNNRNFQFAVLDKGFYLRFFKWSEEDSKISELLDRGERIYIRSHKPHPLLNRLFKAVFKKHPYQLEHAKVVTFDQNQFILYDDLGMLIYIDSNGAIQNVVDLSSRLDENLALKDSKLAVNLRSSDQGRNIFYDISYSNGEHRVFRINSPSNSIYAYNLYPEESLRIWSVSENYLLKESVGQIAIEFIPLQENAPLIPIAKIKTLKDDRVFTFNANIFYILRGPQLYEYSFNGNLRKKIDFRESYGTLQKVSESNYSDIIKIEFFNGKWILWDKKLEQIIEKLPPHELRFKEPALIYLADH